MVDYGEVHRQARGFLDLLDRAIDTRAEVATLSVAQMQIVEIAKALSLEGEAPAAGRADRLDQRP